MPSAVLPEVCRGMNFRFAISDSSLRDRSRRSDKDVKWRSEYTMTLSAEPFNREVAL